MSEHRRPWRGVAASLVLCLTLSACTIDFFFELFAPEDLTESSEPTEQAAAAAEQAVEQERKAKKAVDEALGEPKNSEKLREAVDARPRDPRYLLYRASVSLVVGEHPGAPDPKADYEEALALIKANYAGRESAEVQRLSLELMLEAASRVLQAYEGDPAVPAERYAKHLSTYCRSLAAYLEEYEYSAQPVELFVIFAWNPCGIPF